MLRDRGIIFFRKKIIGFSLVELLVSLLILATGILGTASLQVKSVQFNQGSLYRSKATFLASDIADRMRANASQASLYQIGLYEEISNFVDCYGVEVNCSTSMLATYDLATWKTEIAQVLPKGVGSIVASTNGASTLYIITIQYTDDRIEKATKLGKEQAVPPKQVVLKTAI